MGIVSCVAYCGARVRDVPLEETSEVLKEGESFVRIGLYEPDEALLRQVQEEFGLHDLAIEDAHRAHQRPKLEEYGESLFVVLRTVQLDAETHGLRRDARVRRRSRCGDGSPPA
jgi:magnesium transporter